MITLELQYSAPTGLEPELRGEVSALPPGPPYLRLPLQFAKSLEPRLTAQNRLLALGTTFTLIQAWARVRS